MSQKAVRLAGSIWQAVPSIKLPAVNEGQYEQFYEISDTTATANDVSNTKYFYTAAGVRTKGVGVIGQAGICTLLSTTILGSFSTSSTTATDTNKDVTAKNIYNYDCLIVETSVDEVTNGRHICTVAFIWLTAGTDIGTKNGATIATSKMNMKISSQGVVTSRQSTTARGIYPYDCTISSSNNGTATMNMYICYNSTQTGTINNSYTTRVYGANLYNLIGG